jgi:hypothetical protein
MTLTSVRFTPDGVSADTHRHHEREPMLAGYLEEARSLFADLPEPPAEAAPEGPVGEHFERLRWFWLPGELPART